MDDFFDLNGADISDETDSEDKIADFTGSSHQQSETGEDWTNEEQLSNNITEPRVDFNGDENPYEKTWGDVESGNNEVGSVSYEDPFAAFSATYDVDLFPGFDQFAEIHGTPVEDTALWDHQDDPNSCAIATTNMMFRSLGFDPGEDKIAELFNDMGIYDPAYGTNLYLIDEAINTIADYADININAAEIDGFTEETLSNLLDDGVRPLVGVDASELYDDLWIPPDSGHAVQVTKITKDFVTINDPGFEEGAGQKIPLHKFMNAAADFGFTAISVTIG